MRRSGSIGRAALAKKHSTARQTVTTASGRKLASRKIAKTKRSAAGTAKTATHADRRRFGGTIWHPAPRLLVR